MKPLSLKGKFIFEAPDNQVRNPKTNSINNNPLYQESNTKIIKTLIQIYLTDETIDCQYMKSKH